MKVNDIVNYLEIKYPQINAADFDYGKIGLQFGSKNAEVKKVMIALDGSLAVVNEAVEKDIDLLILHHPFLFSPITSINYDTPLGQKMIKVLSRKLNIFAMHTNFDVASGGMNDILAKMLGLKDIRTSTDCISKDSLLRMGEVDPQMLDSFVQKVSEVFSEKQVRVVGNHNKKIHKVAIVGGSGSSELNNAFRLGCDVLITGEVRHHTALESLELGIALIEVSHSVERFFAADLKKELENEFPNLQIMISDNNINPFN